MRIQHNITAMNAYRNYSTNTNAIGKNLEKLSSGYKINRAGDDAAGLAVSQKMRLQIAGLAQAQKNAKSGISYVQTAEGALQEVHTMLERMYTIAEQSANGTYDSSTDRVQLQKELNQLREEIDRIGKTANFNGQGVFTQYVGGTGAADPTSYTATGTVSGTTLRAVSTTATPAAAAVTAKYTIAAGALTTTSAAGQVSALVVIAGVTATLSTNSGAPATLGNSEVTAWANQYNAGSHGYTATVSGTDITFTAVSAGAIGGEGPAAAPAGATLSVTGVDAVAAQPAKNGYDLSGVTAGDSITVNSKTYTFDAGATSTDTDKFKDLDDLKTKLANDGVDMKASGTLYVFEEKTEAGGGNVSFWIGAENIKDTSLPTDQQMVNKLSVNGLSLSQNEMTVAGTTVPKGNISTVDISTADKAMSSLQDIKAASDAVSDMRGTLGAMQNRLEHTINNLSVMEENMQDAESVIRDTDVAQEMMAYTKNSILIQSAQAMLAQANQLPQGVLQLLQ